MDSFIHSLAGLQHAGPLLYVLVLLLSFLESLVFTGMFVPGTLIIVITGGFAAHGYSSFWLLVMFAAIGAVAGDGISFECGRRGGMKLRDDSILKKHIDRAAPILRKHRRKSIIIGRFLGPLRPVVPFLTGLAGMHRAQFYAIELVSAVSWSVFYIGIGYVFGAAWRLALLWSSRLLLLAIIAFIVLSIVAWVWRWMIDWGKTYAVIWAARIRARWLVFESRPAVHAWMKRHARGVGFVRRRFSMHSFTGLPLTCLAAAVTICLLLFAGIAQDLIAHDPITTLDVRVENLLVTFRNVQLLSFFYIVTEFGDWRIVFITALILSAFLLLMRRRAEIIALWTALLGGDAVTLIAKAYFQRPRPSGMIPALHESTYSFPSSHAAVSIAFYGFLAYLFVRGNPEWKGKVSDVFAAVLIACLIDFSRLYLGVHYLSDVLAGNIVGLAALFFAISLCEWLLWRSRNAHPRSFRRTSAAVVAAVECMCVAWMVSSVPVQWLSTNGSFAESRAVVLRDVLPLFAYGSLPRFTESLFGAREEPVSLIVIGDERCMLSAFDRSGWQRADQMSVDSALRILQAEFLGQPLHSPPMSSLFFDSNTQNYAFEKASSPGDENAAHLARVWQTPYQTEAGTVFVATVMLERRSKWTPLHVIDPAIDSQREILLKDLLHADAVLRYERVPFVAPIKNHMYVTDGKADVVQLEPCAGGQ